MNIINLNSSIDLSNAQISFAESVINSGNNDPHIERDSLSEIVKRIPIFLVNEETQREFNCCEDDNNNDNKHKCTDLLGFYQSKGKILGVQTPMIGICLEKIVKCVSSNEELTFLIAKVLVHELAHAKMDMHPNAEYKSIDEFYKWMEEPVSKLSTPITL